jgi:hypothetical protein
MFEVILGSIRLSTDCCCGFGGWFDDEDGCSLSGESESSFCSAFADWDEDILTDL